jgi:predicted membrane channel-forming protein YqfA (hemolysin III family)
MDVLLACCLAIMAALLGFFAVDLMKQKDSFWFVAMLLSAVVLFGALVTHPPAAVVSVLLSGLFIYRQVRKTFH